MKKLLIIITTLMVMSSCSTTKETKSSRIELRKENKLAEQQVVKKAVESRRFIIKLDRLYFSYGGIVDLIPRANYIIIDGEKAIISAAYLGRQYDIKPIAGISMRGESMKYELTSNLPKGMYEIKMKVTNGGTSFDVYLTIGKNGLCNASLSNIKIDFVRYSGHLVPIKDKTVNTPQESKMI
jgi:hypothetical protein